MSERLTLNGGVCAMASTDYCESQEDCYLCGHGKKMREKLAEYEESEQFARALAEKGEATT